jgi:hypothetical protein
MISGEPETIRVGKYIEQLWMMRDQQALTTAILDAIGQFVQPGLDLAQGDEVVGLVDADGRIGLDGRVKDRKQSDQIPLSFGELVEGKRIPPPFRLAPRPEIERQHPGIQARPLGTETI